MTNKKRAKWPLVVIGIPVGFIVLYMLFANAIIKNFLEAKLTHAHGAEVNVGSVSHSLLPLSVDIENVHLTNPTKPSHDQLAIKNITGDIEWGPLLDGEVVMNQLNVLGMRFDAKRPVPGHVYRAPDSKLSINAFGLSKDEIPDIDTLIARARLKTPAAVEQAEATYEQHYSSLKTEYDNLPSKADVAQYKQKIEEIKRLSQGSAADIATAASKLKALKQQIRADKQKYSDFLRNAKTAKSALQVSADNIKQASKSDYDELSLLLAGDDAAFLRITETVFGKEFAQLAEYLTLAMQVLLPMLQGDDAIEDAPETAPSKPFYLWVKNANVSATWHDKEWKSQWQDITTLHERIGRPTRFALDGTQGEETIKTDGEFFIGHDGVTGTQQWELNNIVMKAVELIDSDQLEALIQSANLSSVGQLKLNDNILDGSSQVVLTNLAINADSESAMGAIAANALTGLSELTMDASLAGNLLHPDLHFSSDLDQQVANSLTSQLANSGTHPEIADKLAEITQSQEGLMAKGLGDIDQWLAIAQGDDDVLQELLATQTESLVEKGKSKLLDKLKNKFGQ